MEIRYSQWRYVLGGWLILMCFILQIEYITNYRLQKACYMLVHTRDTISAISQECGLGSSSFFGKTFRANIGITPREYRKNGRIMTHYVIKKIFYS